MKKLLIFLCSVIAIILCSCESSDEKIYKSVISKYDIIMSEFNAAQNVENFNATSEKFSDFKSSELIQEYDSLCSIDKVPKDIQNLVQQKEKEVTAAQFDAMSRLN